MRKWGDEKMNKIIFIVVGCFIMLDLLTGIVKAFREKAYSSTVMREGLYHKCGSILCVVFAVLVDYAQTVIDIGVTVPVTASLCAYIVVMEIGSIIENICAINPDIMPDKLKAFFAKLADGKK